MTEPAKQSEVQDPSRLEEARRLIEEYANDLREVLRKLRRKMH